ncbi:MAG: SDR family oxidoreductase [Terrimicrobiaceae bacterium]
MPHILITGGAGYLGSILTPHLLGLGYHVTVVDNFLFRQFTLAECCASPAFAMVRGDCRDPGVVRPLLSKADIVIPLAALVGAPLCAGDEPAARTVNLDAVRMLLGNLHPGQRVIFPTTNSGYGIGEAGKFCTEETPLRPISLYGTTKVDAEKAVLDRGNSITFRLATVFGMSPRMRLDLLVNDFVYRAATDHAAVIFEGHFKRNYIHIRDVARVFSHGIEQFDLLRDRPYNVGIDDANLSKLELCEKIREHVPGFVFLEAPIGEDPDKRDYIVSNARIAATGFRPEWTLDRGIQELLKGCRILRNNAFGNV